jgi:hypothetical protein
MERQVGRLGKFFDGVLPSALHRSNIHKIYTSCGALSLVDDV